MQWYIDHSPLTYAQDVHLPLFIMHAESDLRCLIEQAEPWLIALKQQRQTIRFMRFPDAHRELSRSGRPRHRVARFAFILDWFSQYLGRL